MVRIARNKDSRVLAEMAVQMWDSHTVDELEAEFVETLNDKQSAFFIKYINDLHKFIDEIKTISSVSSIERIFI